MDAEDKFRRVATLLAGFYHLGAGHALRERQVGFHAQRPAQHDDEADANQAAHQQDQHGLPVVLAQVRPQVLAVDFDHHEGRYGEDRPGDQRFPHRSGRAGDVLLQDAPAHHAEHGDGDHGRRDGGGDSLPRLHSQIGVCRSEDQRQEEPQRHRAEGHFRGIGNVMGSWHKSGWYHDRQCGAGAFACQLLSRQHPQDGSAPPARGAIAGRVRPV
jgi:hypothetical protein